MSPTQLISAADLTIGRRRFLTCSSKLEVAAALVMKTRTNDEDRSFMIAINCFHDVLESGFNVVFVSSIQ